MKNNSLKWAIPGELNVPPDPLKLRLDFHNEAIVMTSFLENETQKKIVSAQDVAHALASELSYGSGLLPDKTLWWNNTKSGSLVAVYVEPKVRILALQKDLEKVQRFKVPLPGLIFLCSPGQAPWVFATKKKPTKETDKIYNAPLANLFSSGKSCPGSHHYPNRINDIIKDFFTSFFTATADLSKRSKKFPKNIIKMWEFLEGKTEYPLEDLVERGNIQRLMEIS